MLRTSWMCATSSLMPNVFMSARTTSSFSKVPESSSSQNLNHARLSVTCGTCLYSRNLGGYFLDTNSNKPSAPTNCALPSAPELSGSHRAHKLPKSLSIFLQSTGICALITVNTCSLSNFPFPSTSQSLNHSFASSVGKGTPRALANAVRHIGHTDPMCSHTARAHRSCKKCLHVRAPLSSTNTAVRSLHSGSKPAPHS